MTIWYMSIAPVALNKKKSPKKINNPHNKYCHQKYFLPEKKTNGKVTIRDKWKRVPRNIKPINLPSLPIRKMERPQKRKPKATA